MVCEQKSYNLIAKLNGTDAKDQSILQDGYGDYMVFRNKKAAMKSFKLFRKMLTEDEIEKVATSLDRYCFKDGEDIIVKGSKTRDLYFVESGVYEICDVKGDWPNQKYFGELSFFLSRPRAATIRASGPVCVFKLSRDDLFDVVDESRFQNEDLAMLADQYQEAGLLERSKEVYEYIQIKSRPKKEPSSVHSVVATLATGMFLVGLVPCFSPGLSEHGVPRLFDFQLSGLTVPET